MIPFIIFMLGVAGVLGRLIRNGTEWKVVCVIE